MMLRTNFNHFIGSDASLKAFGLGHMPAANGPYVPYLSDTVVSHCVNQHGDEHGWSRIINVMQSALDWVGERIGDDPEGTLVTIEDYDYGRMTGMAWDRVELIGSYKFRLLEWGCTVITVPPKSLKKHITGNGNASKDQMRDTMGAQYGLFRADHNESDALGLTLYGYAALGPEQQQLVYTRLPLLAQAA